MNTDKRGRRRFAAAVLMTGTLAGVGVAQAATDETPLYLEVAEVARAPIGWVEFCAPCTLCATQVAASVGIGGRIFAGLLGLYALPPSTRSNAAATPATSTPPKVNP